MKSTTIDCSWCMVLEKKFYLTSPFVKNFKVNEFHGESENKSQDVQFRFQRHVERLNEIIKII